MKDETKYIFTSKRLGFRNWNALDIDIMHEINSDEKVMEFFPGVATKKQTTEFIERMQQHFLEKGYCYFAVDKLENNECIGFIGLYEQTYDADFTPCIDIGWRINKNEWNKGYATEGAKRCLKFAFNELKLESIYSITPKVNIKSELIMAKIGMTKHSECIHPLLMHDERLKTCVVYKIDNGN